MKRNQLSRREALSRAGVLLGTALVNTSAAPAPSPAENGKAPLPFRYCLNTATIRGQKLGLAKEIEIAAKAGYQAIEPWVESIDAYKQGGGSLPDLKRQIADLGLTVESAIGFPEWIVDDDAKRAKGLERAKYEMELVGQIGGKRLAAPLRALAPVFIDSLGELPIDEVGLIHNDPEGPSPAWSNGTLLSHADDGLASAVFTAAGPGARIPFVAAELRHLGAAVAVDVAEGSAVGGRSGAYTLTLIAAPEPSLFQTIVPEAAGKIFDAVRPWINPESNVNFSSNVGAGTPNWSPDVAERLAKVRAKYDPDRVFALH